MSNKHPADDESKKRTQVASGKVEKAAVKVPTSDAPVHAQRRSSRGAAAKAAAPAKTAQPLVAPNDLAGKKSAKPSPKVRPQLVRDSFTMPEADFAFIAILKSRALDVRRAAKKSELLRAGLHALAALDSKTLLAALDQLEPVKIGRPSKAA